MREYELIVPSKTATAQPHKNTFILLSMYTVCPEQKNRRKKIISGDTVEKKNQLTKQGTRKRQKERQRQRQKVQ